MRQPSNRGRGLLAVLSAVVLAMVLANTVRADDSPPDALARHRRLAQGEMASFRFAAPHTRLPDAPLSPLAGGPLRTLSSWRGKLLLLNFWASWCPPCRDEMPSLGRLRQRLAGLPIEVIAVSVDRTAEAAIAFVRETGLRSLPILHDPGASTAGVLSARGLPTTILIDAEGYEIGRLEGTADWQTSEAELLLRAMLLDWPPAPAE